MENKTILVVDDELDMRIFVSTVLETSGFKPIAVENGSQALKKVGSTQPALVILDLMMPKIEDGIQTYQQFKTDARLSHIPIIMLSAIARKTFFHTLKMLGPQKSTPIPEPEAYMEKPPDANELIRLIKILLKS